MSYPTVDEMKRMTPHDGDVGYMMIENIRGEHHIVGMIVSNLEIRYSKNKMMLQNEIIDKLSDRLKQERLWMNANI